jgi:N-acetylglucosamine malate deacetylase 2
MTTRRFRSNDEAVGVLRGALGLDDAPARTLIVAAHPDDDVVGAGGQLIRLGANALVAHVTDGAPPDPGDARAAGFDSAGDYASERRDESLRALALANVPPSHCSSLGFGDQQTAFALAALVRAVAAAIDETSPDLVLTHAYEGGHPDHDATAFAVAWACRLVERRGEGVPILAEFTSYHHGPSGLETGRFLPPSTGEIDVPLSEAVQAAKRSMLAMFTTQQRGLAQLTQTDHERFRIAPSYDFSMPPHDGRLYYERFSWGVDGLKWRALARAAAAELG